MRSIITFLFLLSTSYGMFAAPSFIPIKEIETHLQAELEKTPNNPEVHYLLARAYYLAFIYQSESVATYGAKIPAPIDTPLGLDPVEDSFYPVAKRNVKSKLSNLSSRQDQNTLIENEIARLKKDRSRIFGLPDSRLVDFAAGALKHFDTAIKLDPKSALYRLGRASLMQQILEHNQKPNKNLESAYLEKISISRIRTDYLKAFELSKDSEENIKFRDLSHSISHEAATQWLLLTPDRTVEDEEIAKQMLRQIEVVKKNKHQIITPLIFSLAPADSISDLLGSKVTFDLDGFSTPEPRAWPKETVWFVVYDPHSSGKITSGKQLFGSRTFDLFWPNGYEPLSILDTDHDGWVTANEAPGIRFWNDANRNGISDLGEIKDFNDLGIEALAHRKHRPCSGGYELPDGVRFSNGKTAILWDYVTD